MRVCDGFLVEEIMEEEEEELETVLIDIINLGEMCEQMDREAYRSVMSLLILPFFPHNLQDEF